MRNLIKKILKESEDLGWAEDVVNTMSNPYQLEGDELINFMNKYFQSNPSPKFDRTYRLEREGDRHRHSWNLKDETGVYFYGKMEDLTLDFIIKRVIAYLNGYNIYKDEIFEEFEDLYNTLKPLIHDKPEFYWSQ